MSIYNEIIKDGNQLCFDVGANLGSRTDVFKSIGFKKIIAIEPQLDCISILKEKFGTDDSVTIVEAAMSNTAGKSKIYISNANTISSMSENFIAEVKKARFSTLNWDNSLEIDTYTLDNMIEKYGIPEFIKIDVEGFEVNVIRGLSTPVKYISFEYTPELHSNAIECIETLNKIGEYKFSFSYGESLELATEWLDTKDIKKWLSENVEYDGTGTIKTDASGNFIFGDIYARLN